MSVQQNTHGCELANFIGARHTYFGELPVEVGPIQWEEK
jgi:hypothetical protein